ncbi:MAG: macro domain-containing protein [Thermoanaerobaculia bacterium]
MTFLSRLLGQQKKPESELPSWHIATASGRSLEIVLFTGEITNAPADAICTSTNPRLSLMAGTGGAVRDRAGFGMKRECEAIIAAERERTGREELLPGSAHVTSAGMLDYKALIHCIASDHSHHSSPEIVRLCVTNALAAAERAGCESVAMPPFGAGHAALPFEVSLAAIIAALRESSSSVRRVVIVVLQKNRAREAAAILEGMLGERREKSEG